MILFLLIKHRTSSSPTRHGYILVLTLMIIALSVTVITYVNNKTMAFVPYAKGVIDREKAYLLALSGMNIAMSQLAGQPVSEQQPSPESQGKKGAQPDQSQDAKKLLTFIVPIKNRWQTFVLTKARDGLTGTIQICIMSEEGKIDINQIYDFEQQKFIGDEKNNIKPALQFIMTALEKSTGGKDLFAAFEKFLKERQYKLHDVTELLTIKEFEVLKKRLFYEPPEATQPEKKENRQLYLTDIFTVWSGKPKLEPWLLSDSMSALLGLNRAVAGDNTDTQEKVTQLVKQYKSTMQWQTDWDILLKPLYGKEFKALPQGIELLFTTSFEPTIFSVLSYGKVGKMTQKILAIVNRSKTPNKNGLHEVSIKRLFWL